MLGFVNICHPDYIDEDARALGQAAYKNLSDRGLDLIYIGEPVYDKKTAYSAVETFERSGADGIIIFYGAFVLCSTIMDILTETGLPVVFWGVPMMERHGILSTTGSYVAFSMFNGTVERLGIPHINVIACPDSPEAGGKIRDFAIVCRSFRDLRRCSIGLVGYTSMSIYPGTFDHVLMRWMIGPETEQFDSYTLINRAEAVSAEKTAEALLRYESKMRFPEDASEEMKRKAAGLYIALKEMCEEFSLSAITVKCQYEFSKEYGMTPCLPLSLLAEDGIVTACEGDVPCLVSCLILNLLGGGIVSYGDAIHHDGNTVKLSPCGFMPFSLGNEGLKETFVSTYSVFKGILCSFVMRPGKVTVMRLAETIGGYKMVYFTGEALVSELRGGNMPSVDVRIDGNMDSLTQNYPGQHFAICYGDISERLTMFCKLKKIECVRI